MPKNDKDRITELEIAVSHQQRLLEQLNAVITEQTRQHIKQEKELVKMRELFVELKHRARDTGDNLPDEKPPHY